MSKRILGIDCSSTTIGYCILDLDKDDKIQFVHADYIKPIKTGTIIDRIVNTRDEIQKLLDVFKPDYIGIEEIIQFMQGKSTAKTIIMLTTFNRMVCLLARDYLHKNPELFSVMTIRHGLKIDKVFPKKEDMPELVAHHLGIKFPYLMNSKGKNKGKIKTESFDMADGVAVALYYAFALTGRTKRKIKI